MTNNKPTLATREEIANAIRQLDQRDLRYLNQMIVDRLKLINQAHSTAMLSHFNVGDRVSFLSSTGEPLAGIVIRINKKTASIVTDEGERWNVSPSLLTVDGAEPESTASHSELLQNEKDSND